VAEPTRSGTVESINCRQFRMKFVYLQRLKAAHVMYSATTRRNCAITQVHATLTAEITGDILVDRQQIIKSGPQPADCIMTITSYTIRWGAG